MNKKPVFKEALAEELEYQIMCCERSLKPTSHADRGEMEDAKRFLRQSQGKQMTEVFEDAMTKYRSRLREWERQNP